MSSGAGNGRFRLPCCVRSSNRTEPSLTSVPVKTKWEQLVERVHEVLRVGRLAERRGLGWRFGTHIAGITRAGSRRSLNLRMGPPPPSRGPHQSVRGRWIGRGVAPPLPSASTPSAASSTAYPWVCRGSFTIHIDPDKPNRIEHLRVRQNVSHARISERLMNIRLTRSVFEYQFPANVQGPP